MQRIKTYLTTFVALLAGLAALWIGTLMFFFVLAFALAAALAFRLGTGPRPITIRTRPATHPGAHPASRLPDPTGMRPGVRTGP